MNYGFFRVAAAAPRLRVADPDYNAGQLETVIDRAVAQQVRLLVTPELSVTGYTCADLFFTAALQQAADRAVQRLAAYTAGKDIAVLIGAPVPLTVWPNRFLTPRAAMASVSSAMVDEGVMG